MVDTVPAPGQGPSDEALAFQVAMRSVSAFALLYDRHARTVYSMAVYLLGKDEAEEAVQEVFLRLWEKARQFNEEKGRFEPWFMSVARHHLLDRLRQRSAQQRLMAAEAVEQTLASQGDPSAEVVEGLWRREQASLALRALASLPPEQRKALVLAYFGGLSQSAIAEHLGWPLGTVKKRIRLGLQKLAAALREQAARSGAAPAQSNPKGKA